MDKTAVGLGAVVFMGSTSPVHTLVCEPSSVLAPLTDKALSPKRPELFLVSKAPLMRTVPSPGWAG